MADIRSQLVRGFLQNVSIAYKSEDHIWQEIYPSVALKTREQKITVFNRGDEFRDEAVKRAPGTVTPWSRYDTSTVDLTTENWAKKSGLTKEEIEEDGQTVDNPNLDIQNFVMGKNSRGMSLRIERVTAAHITGETWIDGNVGGEDAAGLWAAATASNTFIADIFNGLDTLRQGGVSLTDIRLLIDYTSYQAVRRLAGMTDISRNDAQSFRYPNADEIARFFGIDKVVIAGSIYSSANKKADGSDFTSVDIWGGANDKGFAMLYKFPKVMGRETMSAGVIGFKPHNDSKKVGTTAQPQVTYKWWNEDSRQWFFEQESQFGVVQTAAPAAYAWVDTHTT